MRTSGIAVTMMTGVAVGLAGGESSPPGEAALPYGSLETYRQELVVVRDQTARTAVQPRIAPVYNGHRWGLSTRWDDSNPNALNVRKKMLEAGIRGTFYLNSKQPEVQEKSLAFKLTGKGECSVGGHSVNHPHLPQLPANDAFRELLANRLTLECLTDTPVNSLAFPFGSYRSTEQPEAFHGITEGVLRSGYRHSVYASFVTNNPHLPGGVVCTGIQVVPGDRQVDADKFWAHLEKIRAAEAGYRKTSDCLFLGVHPWQQGDELTKLGELMKKLHDWDDFWHCTQTEWAAYTMQRRNTTIEPSGPGRFTLTRPCAWDLGNAIPLTLEFDSPEVSAVTVDGVQCELRHVEGKTLVNVPHASRCGTPAVIAGVVEGACAELPGVTATIDFDASTGKAAVELVNGSTEPLKDGVVTAALPPAFDPGLLRWRPGEIAPGNTWRATSTVTQSRVGEYWQGGTPYAAVQLDALHRGRRVRIHASTERPQS